jgi:hypothetical protein
MKIIIRIDGFFLKFAIVLLVILLLFHISASIFQWYYIFPWLDIPVHTIGSMMIGCTVLAFLPESMTVIKKCIWVMGIVLIIGLTIEYFQWFTETFMRTRGSLVIEKKYFNIVKDMASNSIGGLCAFCLAYFTKRV